MSPEELDQKEEQAYILGRQAAMRDVINLALKDVADGELKLLTQMIVERSEVVHALRNVCALVGDNEWPDDLHLVDVIEKHLARHLEHRYGERNANAELAVLLEILEPALDEPFCWGSEQLREQLRLAARGARKALP